MLTIDARSEVAASPLEWAPWVAFVEETLREASLPAWNAAVPAIDNGRPSDAPLLAGAIVSMDPAAVLGALRRLGGVLSRRGTPALARAAAVLKDRVDGPALFAASLRGLDESMVRIADKRSIDSDTLAAVASILPVPFLHACHRRFAGQVSEGWTRAYCPVCGSWPAFAEVLDADRSRRFRCGRCGSGWHAEILRCAFCENRDHAELVMLVPSDDTRHRAVEACMRCSGYVKTFTTLEPCSPGAVMLNDLATVDLDLAALDRGYVRPGGVGYPLRLRVNAAGLIPGY